MNLWSPFNMNLQVVHISRAHALQDVTYTADTTPEEIDPCVAAELIPPACPRNALSRAAGLPTPGWMFSAILLYSFSRFLPETSF
jgi:hypothetical protein